MELLFLQFREPLLVHTEHATTGLNILSKKTMNFPWPFVATKLRPDCLLSDGVCF
uniref:PsbP domain-containing protein 5ic isoform X2 n=1 Tax=Rhizophora mucronata TaxID=61149 RepID=A0A2P2LCZ2_RHIMU